MAAQQNPQHMESAPPPVDAPGVAGSATWFQKLAAVVYTLFCLELGIFLLFFPWYPLWGQNYFSGITPGWYEFWNNPYLRGAISGLGVVNIGIAISEIFRLRRP